MAVSFNTACCMNPACQDEHCPGRALARMHLHKDGGHKVDGDDHVRLSPPDYLPELIPTPRRGAAAALLAFLF